MSKKPSIGMPVYNGEEFIRKRLDNILSQTFSDFELIISDDSTDSTPQICKEYAKKDSRIRYIHQEKNHGVWKNYFFVLKEAKGEYFSWVAVDDLWMPNFLERNVQILDSKDNVVGSIGKLVRFGPTNESTMKKIQKKIKYEKPTYDTYPIYGIYEKKIRYYLKKRSGLFLFSLFRTNELRESVKIEDLEKVGEVSMILNILKYGDIALVDEVLINWREKGLGSTNIVEKYIKKEIPFRKIFYFNLPFIIWCIRNLGWKIFFQNIDNFVSTGCLMAIGTSAQIIRSLKRYYFM